MSHRRLILFSMILTGCCFCDLSFAQVSAEAKKRKKDPRAAIKKWDKNGNGLLEASEIPEERREMMAGWAKKQGLDPKKPLSLEKLLDNAKGDAKRDKLAKKAARKAAKEKPVSSEKAETTAVPENPKAFGAQTKARQRAEANRKSEMEDGERKRDGKGAARLAARSLMYQNDKNKNKRLEKSEWSRLKGDPSKADVDKDGSLSMEELTDHLAGYGSREEKPQPTYRKKKRAAKGTAKKSYRFLTPHERLPEGLPDWFAERDSNFDGQLSLREYAPSLTSAKYEKFVQLDLNKDGFLVAKEYLSATK